MLTTLARAGALALLLLAVPASAQAASPPLLTTTQYVLSTSVGGTSGFEAHATDPDGDAVTLTWTFDDGTTATGEQVSKGWDVPGIHTGTVTATDATGLTASHTFTIEIRPGVDGFKGTPLTGPPPGFVFPDVNARPEAALADPRLKLSKTRSIPVRITCKTRPCKGTIALKLGAKLVGTASFSLRPGQATTAYVRVSRPMAARLRKHRSVAVAVTLAVRGAEPASTTGTLTLRTR